MLSIIENLICNNAFNAAELSKMEAGYIARYTVGKKNFIFKNPYGKLHVEAEKEMAGFNKPVYRNGYRVVATLRIYATLESSLVSEQESDAYIIFEKYNGCWWEVKSEEPAITVDHCD